MSSEPLGDRYSTLIDQIVQATLKGNIRAKEQVYQMLVDEVEPGTDDVFEQVLRDRLDTTQQQANDRSDELKQAKATRSLRALKTIAAEWGRWQEKHRADEVMSGSLFQILSAADGERVLALLKVLDPNRDRPLNLTQVQQLTKQLRHLPTANAATQAELAALAAGLEHGLECWSNLQNHIVSWLYDQSQGQLGFGGVPGQQGPWAAWAKQVNRFVPQSLFAALATDQTAGEWVAATPTLDASDLVELALALRCLQQGLVNWFDKLVYDAKVGAKLSISTYLSFSVVWSQLANGLFQRVGDRTLAEGCFIITLQILREFAQRPYFPLYGGIFASFTGKYLRGALDYLDEPLRRAEGTQEKARILTLLGASCRALGDTQRAIAFHTQALDIAQPAADHPCSIANLNHLSRTYAEQRQFNEAVDFSQRALVLSRQVGDRLGEANALTNLGYAEVLRAQQREYAEPEVYESAIEYLTQGLQLAEKLGDRQSQALCLSSLGIACLALERTEEAIAHLQRGIEAAQFSGDLSLQGMNLSQLAEAYYRQEQRQEAIAAAALAMYLLEQIGAEQWRHPAGLLTILQGQMGNEAFQTALNNQRPKLIAVIGVDGFDHLPILLQHYRSDASDSIA